MKAVFSEAALSDLDEIFEYTAIHYPSLEAKLEQRIRDAVRHIKTWPESARRLEGSANVRILPLVRYPFKLFYQIESERILILHIHHTSRHSW